MTAPFVPVGDPDAMRALAQELLGRADLVATAGAQPMSALAGSVFEGPAADRLRGTLEDSRSDALAAADRLRDIAASLSSDANEVERRNSELQREAAKKEEEAAAAAAPQQSADAPPAETTSTTTTTTTVPVDPPADPPADVANEEIG